MLGGVPTARLKRWRTQRTGPLVLHIGRHVRYRRSAVETWLNEKDQEAADWMASYAEPNRTRRTWRDRRQATVDRKLAGRVQVRDIDGRVRSVRVSDPTKGAATRRLERRRTSST